MVNVSDLHKVTEFDTARESYEFHLYGVFFDPRDNRYYTLTDSGCSCPSPWEDYRVEISEENGPHTFTEALRALDKFSAESSMNDQGWFVDAMMQSRQEFIAFAKGNGTFPGNWGSDY